MQVGDICHVIINIVLQILPFFVRKERLYAAVRLQESSVPACVYAKTKRNRNTVCNAVCFGLQSLDSGSVALR